MWYLRSAIITCTLGDTSNLTLQSSRHSQIPISKAKIYSGRTDAATTQHCNVCILQDSHILSRLLLMGGKMTFCLIHLSNSSSKSNLPPTVCIDLAISILYIPLLCPAPADLIHGDEDLRVKGSATYLYSTDHKTAGISASCHSVTVIEIIIFFKNHMM